MDIAKLEVFDWDSGNISKNYIKHKVSWEEAESVFKNKPLILFDDKKHSEKETRYGVLGKSAEGRKLTLTITIRENRIRVISARDQNKKENIFYKNHEK